MSDQQTSLTAPVDQVAQEYTPTTHPPLDDDETRVAMTDLSVSGLIAKYNRVERKFADPFLPGQTYSLHSFIPAKGASPDSEGIYGMIKIRGTFSSIQEMNEKAEDLIRNHDSYHKIFHGFVGKPLPLTVKSDWSQEVEEIDIQKAVAKTVTDNIKAERNKERQEVNEIREREKNIRENVEAESTDPYEVYTCLRVKKAQVIWGYMEHRKKLHEMKDVFEKTLAEVAEYDEKSPDYKEKYLERYMDARARAGIPEDKHDVSFMKYLNHDVMDLEGYAIEAEREEEEAKKLGDDSDFKSSRLAGSTITVRRRETALVEDKKEDGLASVEEISEETMVEEKED